MEPNGFRHRRSPSGDRFLGAFSFSPTPGSAVGGGGGGGGGGELNEAEVCFSGDFPEPRPRHRSALSSSSSDAALWASGGGGGGHRHPLTRQLQVNGILAALPGKGAAPAPNVVIPSMSSSSSSSSPSKPVPPTAPRRHPAGQEREYSQSVPCGKFRQSSAPMNVPAPLAALPRQGRNRFFEVDNDFEDDEMLPPHEIVARGSGMSPRTTFSVLEGAGRTLKGRDLRQVRNAIWRQTGFLD